jgi:hypothetical protein
MFVQNIKRSKNQVPHYRATGKENGSTVTKMHSTLFLQLLTLPAASIQNRQPILLHPTNQTPPSTMNWFYNKLAQ